MIRRNFAWFLLMTAGSAACSSSSGMVCIPGQSKACVGVGGCQGGQACASDGKSYEVCQCSGAGTSGTSGGTTTTGGTSSGLTGSGSGGTTTAGSTGGAPPTSTAIVGAILVGNGAGSGDPYALSLMVSSGRLPGDPTQTGSVAAHGALTSSITAITAELSGTYDTDTGVLSVSGTDNQSGSWSIDATWMSDAGLGERFGGQVQGPSLSGPVVGLFVPPFGLGAVFCGSCFSCGAGGGNVSFAVSSDGTAAAIVDSDGDIAESTGTVHDGGLSFFGGAIECSIEVVDGGLSEQGFATSPDADAGNGC